jgi:2-(1,2-epoxy-1,2-dihydrophenyl)acetyl-CoA isomerase
MEKPVIAAVNGVAAGAGASLAFACDFRIAGEHAKFFMAFVKIGLIPDAGSNHLLPQLIGYAKALELAMTGDIIDAETALSLGLVTRVVPAGDLMKEARAWAEPFATGPTRAYALTKRSMRYGATHDLRQTLEVEAELQDQAAMTQDVREGITAFREKRAPNFQGK